MEGHNLKGLTATWEGMLGSTRDPPTAKLFNTAPEPEKCRNVTISVSVRAQFVPSMYVYTCDIRAY